MSAMLVSLLFSATSMDVKAKTKTMQLRIIETSDVHGSFFPYDFITRKPKQGTLARVSSYCLKMATSSKDNQPATITTILIRRYPTWHRKS